MKQMAASYNIAHKQTIAYFPSMNGTVERLRRDILRASRCTLAELKLAPQNWSSIIGAIQSVLNEAPLERSGKMSTELLELAQSSDWCRTFATFTSYYNWYSKRKVPKYFQGQSRRAFEPITHARCDEQYAQKSFTACLKPSRKGHWSL